MPTAKTLTAAGFRNVTHCIFDMDGLLLDTERLYTAAIQKILDNYEKQFTWEVKLTLMGLQHEPMCKRVVEIYDLPLTWQEYSKMQREVSAEMMSNTDLMPDTEPIYEEITRRIAKSFGRPYPHDVRMKIMGTTEQLSAKIAVNDLKLPISVEEYLRRYNVLCRQMLGDGSLLQGAERFLRHLHANNIPFCLATSSGAEMVEIKIQNHRELFKLFGHRVCGSSDPDVKEGKPAPDIFLVAASRFADKPSPSECLVFEDAPNGVKAAITAGMQCVMVPDEQVPREMCTEATQILRSLEHLKPEDFGLPAYSD